MAYQFNEKVAIEQLMDSIKENLEYWIEDGNESYGGYPSYFENLKEIGIDPNLSNLEEIVIAEYEKRLKSISIHDLESIYREYLSGEGIRNITKIV
jgi:hypothetical protein